MWCLLSILLSVVALAQEGDTPVSDLPAELQDVFLDAEAAWQSGRLDEAAEGFDQVIAEAPSFDRAWRRACGVRVEQGRHLKAIALCRDAVQRKASLENRTGLAIALLHGRGDRTEAGELIDEVTAEAPDFVAGWQALCSYALKEDDTTRLRRCVKGLRDRTPSAPAVPLFTGLLEAHESRFDNAWRQLDIAASMGVPAPLLASIRARVSSRYAQHQAQQQPTEGEWTLSDAAPLLIVLLLIGGVILLAISDDGDEEEATP